MISARDFVDKKMIIRDGNITYIWMSALPDDILPPNDDVIRGYGIVGL